MIKANELRIGNLVYFNGSHNEIGDISEIMKNDLNKVAPYKIGINHIIDIYYDSHKLKPIPLTEEWLLKFGFEIEIGYSHNIAKLGLIRIEFGDNFYFDYLYGRTKIEYVHQLQNLYFCLTATELTVA